MTRPPNNPTALLWSGTREDILQWLQDNGPAGLYLDDARADAGLLPITFHAARQRMAANHYHVWI